MASPSSQDLFAGPNLSFLLGRPLRTIDVDVGRSEIQGAPVVVTGAADSVGRALVARLLTYQPGSVTALDSHEASLFQLGRDGGGDDRLDLRVADVRNETKMRRLFAEVRPRVVFHLAAYKHVPFGEREADEPVSVNVLGTDTVARVATEAGVAHLVYPSSDKAVNPPSIYGATKRLAETVLLSDADGSSDTAAHVVRYVNILGSSGSVLETFVQQAWQARPFTLTDERMTRYWMSMDEGVDLLIHSLSLGAGSLTLLDSAEPTSVKAMAERLFQLLRAEGRPEFVTTGARPGERLAEELVSESEAISSLGDGVLCIRRTADPRPVDREALIAELRQLVEIGEPEPLRARVMELARSLQ